MRIFIRTLNIKTKSRKSIGFALDLARCVLSAGTDCKELVKKAKLYEGELKSILRKIIEAQHDATKRNVIIELHFNYIQNKIPSLYVFQLLPETDMRRPRAVIPLLEKQYIKRTKPRIKLHK